MIKIKNIKLKEENTKLCADIEYNNEIQEIWYKTDKENCKYLCTERADCFVVGLLLFAMEKKEDIIVEGTPVSAKLYQNLILTFIPSLARCGEKYKEIKIISETSSDKLENANLNGASMSCGVDSFTTLKEYTSEIVNNDLKINCLTFFNMGSSGDMGGEKARDLFNLRKERIKSFAKEYGYKFINIDSNLSDFLKMNFYETHTFRNCSAVLAMQKLFKNYYYSSGETVLKFNLNHHKPAAYDIFTLSMISNDNVNFYSTGSPYGRIEKTKIVSEFKPSYKYLNVCVRENENCCVCEKCLRTIFTLQAIGNLDKYNKVFDLELIKKNRTKNEEFLLRKVDENLVLYKELYKLLKENGQEISIETKYRNKKSSYELFRNKENVAYAQETILCMDCTPTEKEKKSIGISVIDLSIREKIKNKQLEYEDFIKRIIIKFAKRRYNVYLFAFKEQDNNSINRILQTVPKKYTKKINIVTYQNEIQAFIKQYSKMEYMVTTPYYSLILSALFDHKIYNLIYNKRQENTLKELELSENYKNIKDLTFETIMKKKEFVTVQRSKVEWIKEMLNKEWKFFDSVYNIIDMKQDYLNEEE